MLISIFEQTEKIATDAELRRIWIMDLCFNSSGLSGHEINKKKTP